MLLRRYDTQSHILIAIGQFTLATGILTGRFLPKLWHSDFGTGFSHGVSGSLLGLSVIMNLYALLKYRKLREIKVD